MLEQVAVIVREGQFDDRQEQHHQDGDERHHDGVVEPFRDPLGESCAKLAQARAAAGNRKRQKNDARSRSPQEVGPPAQPVVTSRFVFVQSSSQYPVFRKFWLLHLNADYWLLANGSLICSSSA